MQLACDVQIPQVFGGVEGQAIYIGECVMNFFFSVKRFLQALLLFSNILLTPTFTIVVDQNN